jgi:hypothetical protein
MPPEFKRIGEDIERCQSLQVELDALSEAMTQSNCFSNQELEAARVASDENSSLLTTKREELALGLEIWEKDIQQLQALVSKRHKIICRHETTIALFPSLLQALATGQLSAEQELNDTKTRIGITSEDNGASTEADPTSDRQSKRTPNGDHIAGADVLATSKQQRSATSVARPAEDPGVCAAADAGQRHAVAEESTG